MGQESTKADSLQAKLDRLLALEKALAKVQHLLVSHLTKVIQEKLGSASIDNDAINAAWDRVQAEAKDLLNKKPTALAELPQWICNHKKAAATRTVDLFLVVAESTEGCLRYWAPDSVVGAGYSHISLAAVRTRSTLSKDLDLEKLHTISLKLSDLQSGGVGTAWSERKCTTVAELRLRDRWHWSFDLVGGFMSLLCVPIPEDLGTPVTSVLTGSPQLSGVAVVVSPAPNFFTEEVKTAVLGAMNAHWITGQMRQIQLLQSIWHDVEVDETTGDGLGENTALYSESAACTNFIADVRSYAPCDYTVLLRGETGTGKEVIAHALHSLSRRRKGPFIKVDCATIPATLLESVLFGHKKGAFTGATEARKGYFVAAQEGTIFLDEIGEMELELQVKILRVLEDRVVVPVGDVNPVPVDVRIVAATHQDLELMVHERRFREDLFYRLKELEILLPPLRERCEDVLPLSQRFLAKAAEELGYQEVPALSAEAKAALMQHAWPGNIRELRNAMKRAAVRAGNRLILIDDLGLATQRPQTGAVAEPPAAGRGPGEAKPAAAAGGSANWAPASTGWLSEWTAEDFANCDADQVALMVMDILKETKASDLVNGLTTAFAQLHTHVPKAREKGGMWPPAFCRRLISSLMNGHCEGREQAINAIEASLIRSGWNLPGTIRKLRESATS